MDFYRIDIKKGNIKLPLIYVLLKWVIMVYVTAALIFLAYKLYYLSLGRIAVFYEWLAVIINLFLVVVLSRQLLKLWNTTRYIIITNDHIKFRQNFPWASRISWSRLKQIQFGYSSVRFVSKAGKKYRFSLSNVTQEDQWKLYQAMEAASSSNQVELLQPQL